VESSESLSKAASEADAMVKLQDGLTNATYPEPMRTRLLEGALLAIAALCAVREANRKLVWGVKIGHLVCFGVIEKTKQDVILVTTGGRVAGHCRPLCRLQGEKKVGVPGGSGTLGLGAGHVRRETRGILFFGFIFFCVVFLPLQSACILVGAGAHSQQSIRDSSSCFFPPFFYASTWRL
jgi:hypothetical protein